MQSQVTMYFLDICFAYNKLLPGIFAVTLEDGRGGPEARGVSLVSWLRVAMGRKSPEPALVVWRARWSWRQPRAQGWPAEPSTWRTCSPAPHGCQGPGCGSTRLLAFWGLNLELTHMKTALCHSQWRRSQGPSPF